MSEAVDFTKNLEEPVASSQTPEVEAPVGNEADSNADEMSWAQLTKDMTTDAPDTAIIDADNPPDAPKVEATKVPETVVQPPEAAAAIAEPPPKVEEPKTTPTEAPKVESLPPTPEVKANEFSQLQANFIEEAAKQYQLTDEQAVQLMSEPNMVLPRLAATLEANITQRLVQTMAQMVQQFVPQYTEHYTTLRQQTSKAEDAFFSKWEELKPHKERVMEVGRIYRQMKPQATAEEFIRDVGMQVWMANGLPVEKLASKLMNTPPPAPQPTPAPRPLEGYAPANPGGRGPGSAPVPSNPFELLTQEIMETNR